MLSVSLSANFTAPSPLLPCPQVPNVMLRKLPSGAGGASCVAFSTDGTHVAVAASDSPRADPFRIIIYKWVFQFHLCLYTFSEAD